jgi:hypothetical protein
MVHRCSSSHGSVAPDRNACFAGAYVFKGTRGKVVDVRPGPGGMKPPACLAVSRNGSYLLAAAGGRVTLSNLLTSKVRAPPTSMRVQRTP